MDERRNKILNSKHRNLKDLINKPGIIKVPGIFDAFTAKIAEHLGLEAVYMTGSGTSAALLGKPDVGLITLSEMVTNARYITSAIKIPLISDADTGYGNAINVMRTVYEFEQAGVSAIHLEDQKIPKKCGHMEGKKLISAEEMVGKIKAALCSRRNPDFLIIARTDARAVLGLEEAIRRGKLYRDAGADIIFGEALKTKEEFKEFAEAVQGLPLLADSTEWGVSPLLSSSELEDLNYKIIIYSTAALRVVHHSVLELFKEIKETGTQEKFINSMEHRQTTYDLLGYSLMRDLENRFLPFEDGK